MRSLARALLVAAIALALAGWAFLASSFGAPVPDAWGVRGANGLLGVAFAWTGYIVTTHQPRNPVGWLLLSIGVVAAFDNAALEYASYALYGRGGVPGGTLGAWVHEWIWPAYMALISATFLRFPNGRLLSARWRPVQWASAVAAAGAALMFAFTPGPMNTFGLEDPVGLAVLPAAAGDQRAGGVVGVLLAVVIAAGLAAGLSLVLRFRASPDDVRQQIKWLAAAAVLVFLMLPITVLSPSGKVGQVLVLAAVLAVPAAIAIAITRYRLYEIDTIINRAVVYGALTALLAGIFAAVQEVLKRVFVGATGGSSELTVVLALFLIATLFAPTRARLQKWVDKRFRPAGEHADAIATPAAQALRDVARLHLEGIITDAEFADKKAELLARI